MAEAPHSAAGSRHDDEKLGSRVQLSSSISAEKNLTESLKSAAAASSRIRAFRFASFRRVDSSPLDFYFFRLYPKTAPLTSTKSLYLGKDAFKVLRI